MFYKIVLEPELETQTQQSTANKQLPAGLENQSTYRHVPQDIKPQATFLMYFPLPDGSRRKEWS
jgi:hypothetical protein